jgi:hypothetical protein
VLDLPNEIDDKLRETLITLDNETLEELAMKSKKNILIFLNKFKENNINNEKDIQNTTTDNNKSEKQIQNTILDKKALEQQEQLQEIQKIKSILTPEILQNFPKLQNTLDNGTITEIITSLQDNLPNLVKDLG